MSVLQEVSQNEDLPLPRRPDDLGSLNESSWRPSPTLPNAASSAAPAVSDHVASWLMSRLARIGLGGPSRRATMPRGRPWSRGVRGTNLPRSLPAPLAGQQR